MFFNKYISWLFKNRVVYVLFCICIIQINLMANYEDIIYSYGSYSWQSKKGVDGSNFWVIHYHYFKGKYKKGWTTHPGIDFNMGSPGDSKAIVKSFGFGQIINNAPNTYNTIAIRSLLNNGEAVDFRLLHLKDNLFPWAKNAKGKYVVQGEPLGWEGKKGAPSYHLHLEVGEKNYINDSSLGALIIGDENATKDENIRGITCYKHKAQYGTSTGVTGCIFYPNDIKDQYKILLPKIESVYRIKDSKLNIKFSIKRLREKIFSTIGVKYIKINGENRSYINTHGKKLSKNNITVNGIRYFNNYNLNLSEGEYLISVQIDDNISYPLKIDVLDSYNDIIVDNDENSIYFNKGDIESIKVPGYFLTADLYKGKSNAWAQYKPYREGKYKIFVHIPEYGPTATKVVYKIKPDGEHTLYSSPINQKDNLNRWIQLKTPEGKTVFDFTYNGYIGIFLGKEEGKNTDINESEYVAFDAVKFIKVKNVESVLDGAGSIVRPNEKCKDIGGYGCYRDIAIMHPHINSNKSSTVVFQWKENISLCKNLKIYSEYPIDAILQQKPWRSLSFDKRYDISLNGGRNNYIIISPSSKWTTLSITSKSPIYYSIPIYAECTNESADYSSYTKVEKSPNSLNVIFDGAKWTGTGSLISMSQTVGYGKSIDVVKINSKENSISSFQWLTSPSCSRLLIKGIYVKNSTSYDDNSIPIKNIEIKEWVGSEYSSVCHSLPCYIDKNNYGYYVIRINTGSYNGKENFIIAQCVSN